MTRRLSDAVTSGNAPSIAAALAKYGILELVHRLGEALACGTDCDDDAVEEAGLLRTRLRYSSRCAQSRHAIAAISAGRLPAA